MRSIRCAWLSLSLACLWANAQGPPVNFNSLPEPPIPSDPLELVTGDAQVVTSPQTRAQLFQALSHAHDLSNVRANPYDLKTTITSFGSGATEGTWQMEDISPGADVYRWSVEGANYSAENLYLSRVLYSTQPAGTVPLRIEQARTAIFFAFLGPRFMPGTMIRTATASYNGKELTCMLYSRSNGLAAPTGRLWEETEYCLENTSGLLITYSPAPGSYALYDYSNALHFNGRVIPGKITITEAGTPFVEAKLQSVTAPVQTDATLFSPRAGMNALGSGSLMSSPLRFPLLVQNSKATTNSTLQPVIVHGNAGPDGRITEAEIASSSNSSLNQSALNIVGRWSMGNETAPGATAQQHEVFVNVKFVSQ